MSDRIHIAGIEVHCVVGVYPRERTVEQPLRVDVEFSLDTRAAGFTCDLTQSVDYDRVTDEIIALLKFREYEMLETAAEEVCAMLLALHTKATAVRLRLEKPQALAGRAASASVEVRRRREDFPVRYEAPAFGEVEIIYESTAAGLYLLHVEPGREIPAHHHRVMRELEWVASGGLIRDGVPVVGFDPVAWPRGQSHHYRNDSSVRATIFCCDTPPFIREDEIVDGGGG